MDGPLSGSGGALLRDLGTRLMVTTPEVFDPLPNSTGIFTDSSQLVQLRGGARHHHRRDLIDRDLDAVLAAAARPPRPHRHLRRHPPARVSPGDRRQHQGPQRQVRRGPEPPRRHARHHRSVAAQHRHISCHRDAAGRHARAHAHDAGRLGCAHQPTGRSPTEARSSSVCPTTVEGSIEERVADRRRTRPRQHAPPAACCRPTTRAWPGGRPTSTCCPPAR